MAERYETTFTLRYSVTTPLPCAPEDAFRVLTDAPGYSRWNSTVTSLEGPIAGGQRLAITVPAAPGRTFRPRVVQLDAPKTMVWRDGFAPMFVGTRTFTLAPEGGGTRFTMVEEFRGAMLPMIKRSLPDFGPIFDQYAADLRLAVQRSPGA